MRFLIDESIEFSLVSFLRRKGFDVASVAKDYQALEDEKILVIARREKRVLITNDKDFGDLIYLRKLPHKGVILFRLKEESVKSKIKLLEKLLKKFPQKIPGRFVVVTETKVRFRT